MKLSLPYKHLQSSKKSSAHDHRQTQVLEELVATDAVSDRRRPWFMSSRGGYRPPSKVVRRVASPSRFLMSNKPCIVAPPRRALSPPIGTVLLNAMNLRLVRVQKEEHPQALRAQGLHRWLSENEKKSIHQGSPSCARCPKPKGARSTISIRTTKAQNQSKDASSAV